MKLRIAALALAIAFLAAPTACIAEMAACSDCCPEAGDEAGAANTDPCGSSSSSSSAETCCDAAPVVPIGEPRLSIDAPAPQLLATFGSTELAIRVPQCDPARGLAAELAFCTSPLRLSVVRLN